MGGVEHVIGQHARLLADAGHAVRVVAGRGASPDGRVRFARLPRADTRHPDVVAVQAELDAGRVPDAFPALVAELRDELLAALAGVDLVFAHNVGSLSRNLALTAALRAVAGSPAAPRVFLWHHDLAWTLPAYRTVLHAGDPWDLLRTAWPGVRHVTVSEARRAALAGLIGVPAAAIAVVPNGVDLAPLLGLRPATRALLRRTDLAALDPLLLLPARVTPRKNIELALRVTAELRVAGHPAAGLVVTGPLDPHDAGAPAYLGELVALRGELGLDGAALFLAELLAEPPADAVVHDLYRLADLLILPSFDEGFGIPILEAAAHRLPIACSDLPALRDLAAGAALLFAPDADPAEVARLVGARLADPLVTLARRVRAEYAWEAVYRRAIAPLLGP